MGATDFSDLKDISRSMRSDILDMSFRCGSMGAHLGGSMSAVDILAVLYMKVMNFRPGDPAWEGRDRFIMSKAHSVMAQYAALHAAGVLCDDDMACAMTDSELLFKHPKMNVKIGIEFSGGSLGQGLSLGVGMAAALLRKGNMTSRVYVMVGDGECDEGAIWEAAAAASHYSLSNLTVIIDCNGLQNDGTTKRVLDKSLLAQRWEAFGFDVRQADGHDYSSIYEALAAKPNGCPAAVIAHTVKGKGVSFAENIVSWHADYLTPALYEQAKSELGVGDV